METTLISLFDEAVAQAKQGWQKLHAGSRAIVYVGSATCGLAAGAGALIVEARRELSRLNIDAELVPVGCIGMCFAEPLVDIEIPGKPRVCYAAVTAAMLREILHEHIVEGNPPARYALGSIGEETIEGIPRLFEHPFLKGQVRIALNNCGLIDPTRADHYLARSGYDGLRRALSMSPDDVIDEVMRSGLRGRGGGGFPTAQKWKFCRASPGSDKYVICNADEGDPGAFMDRAVLEGDPHAVLEGMCIAAYAIGANHGYIYIRAEYPLAIERLRGAMDQMRTLGLLGENVLGSDFSFDLVIKEGAGAFVCGEETALIASIEGRRGMPQARPPFPAVKGLFGKPTSINNVETFANLPGILREGADWFADYGTEKSKGTKTFAITGKINRPGLIEVPMGMTLRDVVYGVGGGIVGGGKFKAAQTGGPSGGCIPAQMMDLPIDYESLAKVGSIMGSGGLVVMDETTCMVDLARYFVSFTENESCGKCVPCRLGTRQMRMILDDICEGRGTEESIAQLEALGEAVRKGSLCGLGQTAPNPVLTTIKYFRDEYLAHVREKHCAAGVCQPLFIAPCSNRCPSEVDVPAYLSLVAENRVEEALRSHMERNPFPSVCARVCPHPCEQRCVRADLDESVSIRGVKRFMVDAAINVSMPVMERPAAERRRVAIVGAGPAGLTAAYFVRRLGHEVTVFEAMSEPGGMLRYGIPAYRLPTDELERDIARITEMGVKIVCNAAVGKDIPVASLYDDFDAVFVGSGAWSDVTMGVPGEEARGVASGIEFLKKVTLGEIDKLDGDVVVVGGGNTAIDAARTALRLGAKQVTVVYRRTREEMPVQPEEVSEALEEGIKFEFLLAPIEVIGDGKGGAAALKLQRMRLGNFDSSGRRQPQPIEGDFLKIPAANIIRAIGQRPVVPSGGPPVSKRGTIAVDQFSLATDQAGVFAGGDAVLGPATAVEAIAHGRRAAEAIERYLHPDRPVHFPWTAPRYFGTAFDPNAVPSPATRSKTPKLDPMNRRRTFQEVELTLCAADARGEAGRCLRCDFGKTIVSREEE